MNIVGVKHNLQNIELKEIDEFETIVDTLLGQILDEHDKENSKDVTNSNNNNNQMEASAISYPPNATKFSNKQSKSACKLQVSW